MDFIIQVIAVVLSLVGYYYNIKKNKISFVLWFIANCLWIAINVQHGIWSQAGLLVVYNIGSLIGFFQWRTTNDTHHQ